MDQEDLEWMAREAREREEKAQHTAEEELVRCTLQEEEAARAAESPPWDENDEALDYYDNLDQDSDTAPASSQETVPMSSQESKATAPTSSQESVTEETMPSLETATGATILDATDEINMEDETCLEGPTLKCSLQE